jgi:hypothetical protein
VPPSEFLFRLQVTGCDPNQAVLSEVSEQICRYAGCAHGTAAEVARQLSQLFERERGDGGNSLDIRFHRRGEQLDVLVSAQGRELWSTSRRSGS